MFNLVSAEVRVDPGREAGKVVRRLPSPTLFEAKLFRAEADPAYASSLLFINCFYVLGLWLQSGSLYFAVS